MFREKLSYGLLIIAPALERLGIEYNVTNFRNYKDGTNRCAYCYFSLIIYITLERGLFFFFFLLFGAIITKSSYQCTS